VLGGDTIKYNGGWVQWTVDTVLAIESLPYESDVFVVGAALENFLRNIFGQNNFFFSLKL